MRSTQHLQHLQPFGCQIQVYDPLLPISFFKNQGVEPVELDDLLKTSKVIFILAKPDNSNKALISREKLLLIQPESTFVLICRASLVDFDALVEFIEEGKFNAGIDVFPEEPVPEDHPIRKVKNAVLTSHLAGNVSDGVKEIGRMMVDDIEAMVSGITPTRMQAAVPEFVFRVE